MTWSRPNCTTGIFSVSVSFALPPLLLSLLPLASLTDGKIERTFASCNELNIADVVVAGAYWLSREGTMPALSTVGARHSCGR